VCDKCKTIDLMIARYRRLTSQISDQQMNDANDRLVAQLEAEKLSLHPETGRSIVP